MIVVASRPPPTLQRIYKVHANSRRMTSKPRRRKVIAKPVEASSQDLVRGVQLTAEMFTAAVFVYSSLNYFMYRNLQKDHEKNKKK